MLFITFEGPEGSGKSSVLQEVATLLAAAKMPVIVTREPGGSVISEEIRTVILKKEHDKMDPWTEVLLYIAARRQHLVEKIFPELSSNKVIICDRFSDSTVAYQGYGRNLDIKKINQMQEIVFENFKPNLTIFFDLKPEIGLLRVKKRSKSDSNRLDEEKLSFHRTVYQGYQKIIAQDKKRFAIVDAGQEFSAVVANVFAIIKKFITEKQA